MIKVLKSEERGKADHGWLKAKHSFSFGDYYDADRMGVSALRVINEDRIEGGAGFPTHSHRDMEIITYIVDGVLEHKDSMGNTATISPGEVQRMSAGTGVRHSEYNHLTDTKTHLLQIWFLPDKSGYPPSYEQKNFSSALAKGELVLVASKEGRDASVSLNQDVDMYVAKSSVKGEKILNTDETRYYWVQVIRGVVKANDQALGPGDAANISLVTRLHLQWPAETEFILFDLP